MANVNRLPNDPSRPFHDRQDIVVDPQANMNDLVADKKWRMWNIHACLPKGGSALAPFRPNWCQELAYVVVEEKGFLRVIVLKGRQQGFSTWFELDMLDDVLFNTYFSGGVVADTTKHGQRLLYDKILQSFNKIPMLIREQFELNKDNKEAIEFHHYSKITVAADFIGDTLDYLHVTEYGRMAQVSEAKAHVVRTKTMPAMHADAKVAIESTGEGPGGSHEAWWKTCVSAFAQYEAGNRQWEPRRDVYPLFAPAFLHPENYSNTPIDISPQNAQYFNELEKKTQKPVRETFKWWYIREKEQLKDSIFQQYPNTDDEPWRVSTEFSVFAPQMQRIREQGRILPDLKHERGRRVHVGFDIGFRDLTAIWFGQYDGEWWRFLHAYAENRMETAFYIDYITELRREKNWQIGIIALPHDAEQQRMGDPHGVIGEFMRSEYDVVPVPRVRHKIDAIEAARNFLDSRCKFDENGCSAGINAITMYSWKVNPVSQLPAEQVEHKHSDYADALMTFVSAVNLGYFNEGYNPNLPMTAEPGGAEPTYPIPPQRGKSNESGVYDDIRGFATGHTVKKARHVL